MKFLITALSNTRDCFVEYFSYIKYLFETHGHTVNFCFYNNNTNINNIDSKYDCIIFTRLLPNIKLLNQYKNMTEQFAYLNTEQFSSEFHKKECIKNFQVLSNLSTNETVKLHPVIHLDYSKKNIELIKNQIKSGRFFLIPYGINPQEITTSIKKEKSGCFLGPMSPHREKILDQTKKEDMKINRLKGWGKERDNRLFKNAILINIHKDISRFRVFEEIRCNRCLYNGMMVISEKSLMDTEHPLFKRISWFDGKEDFKRVVNNAFENYEEYLKQFDFKKIREEMIAYSEHQLFLASLKQKESIDNKNQ